MTEDQQDRSESRLHRIDVRLSEIKILMALVIAWVLIVFFSPVKIMKAVVTTMFFGGLVIAVLYLLGLVVEKLLAARRKPSADEMLLEQFLHEDESPDDETEPVSDLKPTATDDVNRTSMLYLAGGTPPLSRGGVVTRPGPAILRGRRAP